jgi:hypothetical protein
MIVRTEQTRILEEAVIRRFEAESVQHVKEFTPRLFSVAGEERIWKVVRLGRSRARNYGFSCTGSFRFYIELMLTFGSDFDSDPQLPWARDALINGSGHEQVRLDRLFERMSAYLDRVAGPKGEHEIAALEKLDGLPNERLRATGDMAGAIIHGFFEIFPSKCDYVGEEILRELVRRGSGLAQNYALPMAQGTALMAGLMFGFGHGVETDLLYPWVSATLTDPLTSDGAGRVGRLYSKTKIYAKRVLDQIPRT